MSSSPEERGRLLATVCLSIIPEMGPVSFDRLLARFRTPERVLNASRSDLMSVEGVKSRLVLAITEAKLEDAERELELVRKAGGSILTREDLPPGLKVLDDSPIILYVKGKLEETDAIAVAIVGSRRCTVYGRNNAERLGYQLAERGITVVSGMARGIDTAAHRGALKAGGRTIAVLGSGLSNVYPAENKKVAERIAGSGAVVSEYSMGMEPLPGNFPRRNRIISGLSLGVVVVEAAQSSGSLITATWAAEQGKDVFAVPGKAGSPTSKGTHSLIKSGAKLVDGVDDIIDELGELGCLIQDGALEDRGRAPAVPEGDEDTVLRLLSEDEPTGIEDVIERSALQAHQVSGVLTKLELKGLVEALPGKSFVLRQSL